MEAKLPNRQNSVNVNFAYLALESICHTGKMGLMETQTPPNRLKELREEHDMTIEQVAEATGLSVSYVWRLESGARNLSVKNMNLFAHAFKVAPEELLAKRERAASNTVPVMGRIGAGAEITPDDEQVPPEGLYEIETMFPIPEGAIAFEVMGDSMWPRYDDGDIVICWRQGILAEEVLGWEAAVKTVTGHRYLKRVVRGAEKGTYDLESHNAAPIRGVRLDWVASIQSVIRSGQWRKLSEAARSSLVRKMTAAE
jgi:transcriptional regulator with XRE-family HTH domain